MRGLILASVAMLLFSVPAVGMQAVPPAYLITPGQGISPLQVGMNITDAVKVMGAPKETTPDAGGTVRYKWFEDIMLTANTARGSHGLYVIADASGKILRVIANYDPCYSLSNGLHDGATEAQVRASMGAPSSVEKVGTIAHVLVYAAGIRFVIVDDATLSGYRTVAEISVVAPST